ncbi:SGNH/GDSL hydrolase family protein [Streptomonospora sediminis]
MIENAKPVRALTGLLLFATLTAGCGSAATQADTPSGEDASSASASPEHDVSPVVLLGDSIAVGQALPMAEALEAADTEFESMAAEGGGNVVGPFADKNWKKLPDQIAAAEPGIVIYQITTYDWGKKEEQRAGYEKLLNTVTETGAELVFVTMPPIKPDEFYKPHMSELEQAADVAGAVAESSEQAHLFDAGEVWGDSYQQTRDGMADRNPDGIHTCPQGAARFTDWLLSELSETYPGFSPAPAEEWAEGDWAADDHFKAC